MNRELIQELTPRSIECLREGYSRETVLADLFAGITVGIVALPLAMAFAIASGVPPERGLITAVIAGFLISALGGSRVQIGGPTGAFVVIVYGIVERHGYDGLATVTLLSGLMLIVLGSCGLGKMIKFIPYPLTTGFTAGIAVIIATSQIRDFFGLTLPSMPSGFIDKWIVYLKHAETINLYAFALGMFSLAILLFCRRRYPRLPGALIAVVSASVAVKLFGLPVETIGSRFGDIPGELPMPHLPAFSLEKAKLLFPEAITVALLAGIESLLSAVVADGMSGDRHKSNCELVGQGVANIASACFGGIPATGAIARTATNVRSGACTPLAGMIHALFLLLAMLSLAPLASAIPLCCLSSVLFVVAWNMSEIDHFRFLLRAPGSDVLVLLSSFFLTVLIDLTVAVEVGVVLSSLLFMKRMSEVEAIDAIPVFQDESSGEDPTSIPQALLKREIPRGVEVFQLQGPFFFGVADKVKDILEILDGVPSVFILRMRKVPVIDATGLHALDELYEKCNRHGTKLLLSGVRDNVAVKLKRTGLWEAIGQENICRNIDDALERARAIMAQEEHASPSEQRSS